MIYEITDMSVVLGLWSEVNKLYYLANQDLNER
jgi:hypothetical protein